MTKHVTARVPICRHRAEPSAARWGQRQRFAIGTAFAEVACAVHSDGAVTALLNGLQLQAALNGTRSKTDHPAIPITPEEQASDARAAVGAGADSVHVHVRDGAGHENLMAVDVAAAVEAIRSACPGTPVGISTGAWIIPDLNRRLTAIRSWEVLPDFASVNLHEAGAADVIRVLLDRGIGVEAGIWNAPAAMTLLDSGLAHHCLRILVEPAECSCRAGGNLRQIETALNGIEHRRLLHGLGRCAWEFVRHGAAAGYDVRIGFEDTLYLPDGTRAQSNAELVAAARRIMADHRDNGDNGGFRGTAVTP